MFPRLFIAVLAGATAFAQTAEAFFDRQTLQDVFIQMDPKDWQQIHDRYMEDVYYRCTFRWNEFEVNGVGIRSRGTQSRSPIKPSIGLDFGRYNSDQRFAGMKTLVMRNLNQDASMMHEYLAEALLARMGLPHSREAYARLYVNGEYAGVYLLVEPIDARFLSVRLGEDNGYLYSMQNLDFAYRFEYLGDDPKLYVPGLFDPKTNTSAPDAEGIREMIRLINETAPSDYAAVVGRVIDLPEMVMHAAAETAIANWDGVLGVNGMRNFYVYRWRDNGRAVFFAWDLDGAFFDSNWPLYEHALENNLIRRALDDPALMRRYREGLDLAAHAMADGGWLDGEIRMVYSLIRDSVYADRFKLCRMPDGISPCPDAMFESEVRHLLDFAAARPAFIWNHEAENFHHEPGSPDLRPEAVVAAGEGRPVLVPVSVARIKANLPLSGPLTNTGYPLPIELGGIRVETPVGPAELVEVSGEGATFVTPSRMPCGPQELRITANGVISNMIMVDVRPSAPAVLGVTHAGGETLTSSWPAGPSEILTVYATGLWRGDRAAVLEKLNVSIGALPARISWAGPAPGLTGIQQINIELPLNLPDGEMAELIVGNDGEISRAYLVPVRR